MSSVLTERLILRGPAKMKSAMIFLMRLTSGRSHVTYVIAILGVLLTSIAMQMKGGGRRHRRRKKLPPGPRGWPVFGILPSLDRDNPARSVLELSKRHGTVFAAQMGSYQTVFLNDFDSIDEAFNQADDDFSDRPRMAVFDILTNGQGIASCYYDNHWEERRRFLHDVLHHFDAEVTSGGNVERIVSREADHLIGAYSQKGIAFDVKSLLDMAVCNVISGVTFGKRSSYAERNFQRFLHALDDISRILDNARTTRHLNFAKYLPFSGYETLDARVRELQSILFVEEVKGHKATYARSQTRDLVDAFMHRMRKEKEEGADPAKVCFNDKSLVQFITDIFVVGTNLTSSSLLWLFLFAAKFEKTQLRVQEELDRVVGRDRLPCLADRANLPFTLAFIFESARFSVVTPFGLPHAAVRDSTFRGFDIPRGTMVVPNLYAVLRDPEVFPDPDEFRTSRFIDETGCFNSKLGERVTAQFGIGRRKCIGEQLVMDARFIIFTRLLHTFTLTAPSGPESFSLKSRGDLTRKPLPFELILTKRTPKISTANKKTHGLK